MEEILVSDAEGIHDDFLAKEIIVVMKGGDTFAMKGLHLTREVHEEFEGTEHHYQEKLVRLLKRNCLDRLLCF